MISAAIFCLIYGIKVLNPTYTDWLLTGGDLTQHYLGWRGYRASDWYFPIGMLDTLAYPNKTSVIFTDSIPIYAFVFKLLSPVLPDKFQYMGFFGIISFVLLGLCTARIIYPKTKNKAITILACILFMFTPVLIMRMYGHTALASQWLIVFSLDLIFNSDKYEEKRKLYTTIALMGAFSAMLHIYYILMCGIILIGYLIISFLRDKNIIKCFSLLLNYIISAAAVVWIFGGFTNTQNEAGGLEKYSFNLNGFINSQGNSKLFKALPLCQDAQYEGFAYLGAGVIFITLLALCIFVIKVKNKRKFFKDNFKQIIAVGLVFLISVFVAASPKITLNDMILVWLRLPNFIIEKWSIFRATGRIIWIAIYIIMILGILGIAATDHKRIACIILLAAIGLQIYDTSDVLLAKNKRFNNVSTYKTSLETTDFWDRLAQNKELKHVIYYETPESKIMNSITNWALDNGKTVSDFYFARRLNKSDKNYKNIDFEKPSSENIYIFALEDKTACTKYNLNYYLVDDMIVGLASPIDEFEQMKEEDFDLEWIFSDNKYIKDNSGEDTDKGRILYPGGTSYGPYWFVPSGKYIIEIRGNKLPTNVELGTYCDKKSKRIEHKIIAFDDTTIKLKVELDADVNNFEVVIKNISDEDAIFNSIKMERYN